MFDISVLTPIQQITAILGFVAIILTGIKFVVSPQRRLEASMWMVFEIFMEIRWGMMCATGVNLYPNSVPGQDIYLIGSAIYLYATLAIIFIASKVIFMQKQVNKMIDGWSHKP
jgi:hypothetical protein